MIKIELAKQEYWQNTVEGYVVFLNESFESCVDVSMIEKTYPHLKSLLRKHQFKGKVGDSFALTTMSEGDSFKTYVFIGIGKLSSVWSKDLESLRRAVGNAILKLKSLEVASAVMNLPAHTPYGVEADELLKQLIVAASMADYSFATFKSKKETTWEATIQFCCSSEDELFQQALEAGCVIADAINSARLLCDMPPNVATPSYVSEQAKEIANNIMGLKCAVFGKEKAQELGMGGFLAVDEGSEQDGKFVILEYLAENKDAPTVALVGKGVTFDSGGISLKPSGSMTGMKYDMAGAAAVIGAMKAIALLKPNIHVIGLTPLVENMPSGRSSKQDDIITFMNGKTAEIVNTDAEGRLILADALCYAEKFYKPDVIIDIATLTGACSYALGPLFSALLTTDAKLAGLIEGAAELTGDRVWALPFDDDFKPAIKSDVADISNCGSPKYKAGTITAGLFLSHFVEKAAWAHLDIAGTADSVPGTSYLGKGATGAGVRLFIDFVMRYKG